jgi:inosine-uridine nucleoside N-ribohydrolase
MSQKTTIWLDCDPGLDDTLAIIYAAHHPNINLIGVSTSPGNTTLANTTKNALNILHNIGRSDLDVFAGSFSQIQGVVKTAEIVHGENGLGGVSVKESPKKALTSNSFAEIYGLIMKQEGKVTWINTGSLTNLCLILMTFPDIKDKLAQIIMMGGAIERGNITPAA